jgi:transposase-like protein
LEAYYIGSTPTRGTLIIPEEIMNPRHNGIITNISEPDGYQIMIKYATCPYCNNHVRMEIGSVVTHKELEMYQEWKCNHCSQIFIYKLGIEANAYKRPTDERK